MEEQAKLLNIYGYGLPDINRTIPKDNRVLLLDERKIKLNDLIIYEIPMPADFYTYGSGRMLSITLAFDPPTRMTRKQYLGATMEFHLFKDVNIEQIKQKYAEIGGFDSDEELHRNEINLVPGLNMVKRGTVQKRMWMIDRTPKIIDGSLKLVVICRDKWIDDDKYKQSYSIVVTVEQREMIGLYNKISGRVLERIQERVRLKG